MKISVIIPAYNAAKTIDRCLNSIINQTYKKLEIIVVNDGSKDDTLSICERYSKFDSRIIIINNENRGVSYSRNCGIEVASGDYITFVDSDDYLNLNCFEILIKNVADLDFIRYNFVLDGGPGFSNCLYDLSNNILDIESNKHKIFEHFLTSNEAIPNLVMLLLIKTTIAKKLKFNENLTMMEDVDFYIQLYLASKKCLFLDKKLYNYYVNPESVTHNYSNFRKNILGVIDTNNIITSRYDDKTLREMLNLISGNHLRIISNIMIDLYYCERKEFKIIFYEINENKDFRGLYKFKRYMPIKNRIMLFFVAKKCFFLEQVYLNLLKVLLIISGKYKFGKGE